MKKLILIVLLSTLTTTFAKVDLGVMTGLQTTNANYKPDEPFVKTLHAMPLIGLYSKFGLSDNFAIQFSPSYTKKKIEANQFLYDLELASGYIDLPILLSFELNFGMLKPYIFAGPNIGIITNPTSNSSGFGFESNEEDISDDVETIEYSIRTGVGLELEFESFSLFGQAYYGHGLNDIYNAPEGVTFPDEVYLRSIDIQLGISFPLSRRD